MKNRRLATLSLPLIAIALLFSACGAIAKPQGWAPPVTADGTTYLFQNKDHLSAVQLSSGNVLWTFPNSQRPGEKDIKLEAVYGAPVVDGDTLYLASYGGDLFAISVADGSLLWEKQDFDGSFVDGPIVSADRIVAGTTEGKLYVRSKTDGTPVSNWPAGGVKLNKGIWATPIVDGDNLYVATMDGEVHAYNLEGGNALWDKPFKASGAVAELTLIAPGKLFVPSLNKHVYIVNTSDGKSTVDFRAEDWVWTTPAVNGNVVYFGDFHGTVYALDITTGKAVWATKNSGAHIKAGPVFTNGTVIVADRTPIVRFYNADSGEQQNTVPLNTGTVRADLVPDNGTALVATTSGKLFRADPQLRTVVELPLGQAPK